MAITKESLTQTIRAIIKNVPPKRQNSAEAAARNMWEKTLTHTCIQNGVVCRALQIARQASNREDIYCNQDHSISSEFMQVGDITSSPCRDFTLPTQNQ